MKNPQGQGQSGITAYTERKEEDFPKNHQKNKTQPESWADMEVCPNG